MKGLVRTKAGPFGSFRASIKLDISRSAHLAVRHHGQHYWQEIVCLSLDDFVFGVETNIPLQPGLDNINAPECKLRTCLVFNHEQSYVAVEAKFDTESTAPKKIVLRFYVDATDDPEDTTCIQVKLEDDLPDQLRTYPATMEYLKNDELWALYCTFKKDKVVAEGLHDKMNSSHESQTGFLETLRQKIKFENVSLYMKNRDATFSRCWEALKTKMKLERKNPPFHEYVGRTSRKYV